MLARKDPAEGPRARVHEGPSSELLVSVVAVVACKGRRSRMPPILRCRVWTHSCHGSGSL